MTTNVTLKSKLYKLIEQREPRIIEHWHSSSIAKCPRALFMERKGIPAINVPGAGKILRWEGGHAMEAAIRPFLQKLYPVLESNTRLTSLAQDLTGEFDNYDPASESLLEIKSVHDYAFKESPDGTVYLKQADGKNARGQNAWKVKLTPYLHHEWQNHAYVLLMQEINVEIQKIEYIYISLSGRMVCYSTDVSPEILANVKKKLQTLRTAWETNTAPECECNEDKPFWNETNQYCDYRTEDGCCEYKEK